MKTLQGLAMGAIMATLILTTGCAGGPGPAKTTLDPMKNVGPVVRLERRTSVVNGITNVTTVEILESPESAQTRLRETELKERGGNTPPSHHRSPGGYWWQTQQQQPVPAVPQGQSGVNYTFSTR